MPINSNLEVVLKTSICFFSFIWLLLIPTFSFGADFCVTTAPELQTALTTATSNGEDDIIKIVQGTYSGNFVYAFSEANNLTIEGGYTSACASREVNPANTVLDGDAKGRVLALSCTEHAPEFAVSGVTLRNGKTSYDGSGLYAMANGGGLSVANNTIIENSTTNSRDGGGVYAEGFTNVTLGNNTISGNLADERGGGIYVYSNNTVTLSNNTIIGNLADSRGGGIYVYSNNTVMLSNNTIAGNSSEYSDGGGVYASSNDTVTVMDNTITGNSSEYRDGGGVCASFNDTVTLINNTISENSAGEVGGGLYALYYAITLTNNIICGNSADELGGGASVSGSTVNLTNNIICGNSADELGGGASVSGSTVNLTNNTIAENSTGDAGGGVYMEIRSNSNTANIYNNIIYQNTAVSGGNDVYIDNDPNGDFSCNTFTLLNNDFDQSAAGTYIKCTYAIDGSNLNNIAPMFTSSTDYHLSLSSPCINTGNNDAPNLPETDKDGNPRIIGGIVDMGCYENKLTLFVSGDDNCGTNAPCYSKIQDAINAAPTGAVIKVIKGTYEELIDLGTGKSVTIKGGYNSIAYSQQTANTTFIQMPGPTIIKASSGSLKFQMIGVK